MKTEQHLIGVVILNYNSSHDCEICIDFVKKQNYPKIHIVVVDNNSKQTDVENIRKICDATQITLIENKENRGFSAGNNIGLKYAASIGCKYALIINPDVEMRDKEALSMLVAKLKSDNNIAVVAPSVLSANGLYDNPLREKTFWEEVFWIYKLFMPKPDVVNYYVGNHKEDGECELVIGCCFLVSISFMQEVNFLDEKTFLYSEESILGKVVKQAGKKIYYISGCEVFHNHVESKKSNLNARFKEYAISRKYYYKRYSGVNWIALKIVNISIDINRLAICVATAIRQIINKRGNL